MCPSISAGASHLDDKTTLVPSAEWDFTLLGRRHVRLVYAPTNRTRKYMNIGVAVGDEKPRIGLISHTFPAQADSKTADD
jgi:hypothetical protein